MRQKHFPTLVFVLLAMVLALFPAISCRPIQPGAAGSQAPILSTPSLQTATEQSQDSQSPATRLEHCRNRPRVVLLRHHQRAQVRQQRHLGRSQRAGWRHRYHLGTQSGEHTGQQQSFCQRGGGGLVLFLGERDRPRRPLYFSPDADGLFPGQPSCSGWLGSRSMSS